MAIARKVTTKTISAKVSLEEFGLICQRAGQANKTVSAYINGLIFAPPTKPAAKGSVKALKAEITRLERELIEKEQSHKAIMAKAAIDFGDVVKTNAEKSIKIQELTKKLKEADDEGLGWDKERDKLWAKYDLLKKELEAYKKAEERNTRIEKLK